MRGGCRLRWVETGKSVTRSVFTDNGKATGT